MGLQIEIYKQMLYFVHNIVYGIGIRIKMFYLNYSRILLNSDYNGIYNFTPIGDRKASITIGIKQILNNKSPKSKN